MTSNNENIDPTLRTTESLIRSLAADAVTPGIAVATYHDTANGPESRGSPGGYFSRSDPKIGTKLDAVHSLRDQEDAMKRLSLNGGENGIRSLDDLKATYPDLNLSGNIISATFNLAYSFKYVKGGEWELSTRRGQSALYDSFAHLSSENSPWNHTVVGWTGEIEATSDPAQQETTPETTVGLGSLNSLSAPIPFEGSSDPDSSTTQPPQSATEGLKISNQAQEKLEQLLAQDKAMRSVPVWLADDKDTTREAICLNDQSRWRRYAERDLYTLFHYRQHIPTDGRKERSQWADYYRMNQKFANKIAENYKPGDIVIVHDYQLLLLPSMLRQRNPDIYICFYLHCPFPSSEFLRCLPRRKEILEGILGSNLVGFQAFSYSRHFSSCCTRILGFPSDTLGVDAFGARVQVGVFPIGIDVEKVEKQAWSDAVNENVAKIKKMYDGKKIIVGRDRLDTARGVAQKLQAFDRFLESYPQYRDKVVLIQITLPKVAESEADDSDTKVPFTVNELVTKINGRYGDLSFAPVQHYPQYLDRSEYLALLRAADIGLITSVRDGMNTTSLEYVLCQKDSNGPLILSEFSGTAGSLQDAIHINPWDLGGVAAQIHKAFDTSSDKRLAMQTSLYNHVTANTCRVWTNNIVQKLLHVLSDSPKKPKTPLLDRTLLLRKYRAAGKRVFMFDYDGTLTPIVREPSAAIPSERMLKGLQALTEDDKNLVWIVSGRDQQFLMQHLGHIDKLGFSAEHGSFMRYPGTKEWVNLAAKYDMAWQEAVIAVYQRFTDMLPGSFIERKRYTLTWHYRLAEDYERAESEAILCRAELEEKVTSAFEVDVMPGKANLEVRPKFINKGEMAKLILNTYNDKQSSYNSANPSGRVEFAMCAGDDTTDEDMFRALGAAVGTDVGLQQEELFTTTVGASEKVTTAKYHLLEPEDVVECVVLLAGVGSQTNEGQGLRIGEVNLAALSAVEGHVPERK